MSDMWRPVDGRDAYNREQRPSGKGAERGDMPDKGSDSMKWLKRAPRIRPTKAHKKLQKGSERPGTSPIGRNGAGAVKRPPRNKG